MKKRAVSVTLHLYFFEFRTSFSMKRSVCPERSASFSSSRTTASVRCTVFLRDTRCPLVINLSVAASFSAYILISSRLEPEAGHDKCLSSVFFLCICFILKINLMCPTFNQKTRSPAGLFSLYYFTPVSGKYTCQKQ